MALVRTLVLAVALAPYAFFVVKDGAMHMGKRKVRAVPLGEHLIHLVIMVPLAWMIAGVFTGDVQAAAFGLLLFLPPALVDEAYFHRKIPETETDAHAKGHLFLLLFLAVGALWWLDDTHVARVLPWR